MGALIGPGRAARALARRARRPGRRRSSPGPALLVLSAPLAITFAALGVRHPVAGGVSAYVREGLGDAAAAVTGGWFLGGRLPRRARGLADRRLLRRRPDRLGHGGRRLGRPRDVRRRPRSRTSLGLRVSSGFQLVLSSVLIGVIVVAIAVALPSRAGDNWTPFAPHGWWAVGHGGEHPRLAVRRLGGGRAARRRLPRPEPRPAAGDGDRVRRRDLRLRRASRSRRSPSPRARARACRSPT